MKFERFHYHSFKDLEQETKKLSIALPFSTNWEVFNESLTLEGVKIANRIVIQPMEGCDGLEDGRPSELTRRRYLRFARSGAGIIWFEAVAVQPDGRANPRQLMITKDNLDSFKQLIDEVKKEAMKLNGIEPCIIMQATHSGRYSKLEKARPKIACHNPILEKEPLDESCIVTDDYLKQLESAYEKAAKLASLAGFDGIDVKACHRYLLNELFSAYTRPGIYGGSFENRTRMFLNASEAAKAGLSSGKVLTTRMNVFDAIPYPYGWGVSKEDELVPDMTEPIKLIQLMEEKYGVKLFNLTLGNPYFNPHVNRPYDQGAYEPPYHPLESIGRAFHCFSTVKKECKSAITISSAHSYLRQFSSHYAAGMLEGQHADFVGFGRQAFAYPEFARDLIRNGTLDEKKTCITCSKCTELMRCGSTPGCVIRDKNVYLDIYRKDVLGFSEKSSDIAKKF